MLLLNSYPIRYAYIDRKSAIVFIVLILAMPALAAQELFNVIN